MTPTVYIFAGIANTGTIQTAVTGYKISAKKDGNTYQGTIMAAPKVTTIYPVNPEIMGSQSFELHDDDSLSNKTIAAIQPGNVTYGYLMVTFKTVADYTVLSGGLEIIMTFNDVFRNQYTIDQTTHIVTNEKIPFLQFPGTHMFPDTK
jgi:hypothetical protein